MSIPEGTKVGRYEIRSILGSGGMGEVYLADVAEGHYSLANLKTYAWQWADAESEYKRAIELNPNLALAHRWYASYLRLVGRNEQAVAEIRRARELDPLSPGVNATVGYLLFGARQYDQAIDVLKKTLELDQTYPYAHLFLGFTYAAMVQSFLARAPPQYGRLLFLRLLVPSSCLRSEPRQKALFERPSSLAW